MAARSCSLSATLIVRDEHEHLDGCLAALDGLVDELVVVDTGSTDDSIDIARRHGACVETFTWIDDFAAARNHAKSLARTDWILTIDADERVLPADRSALDLLLSHPQALGGTVALRPMTGMTRYRELRLVRNHPEIVFEGDIHESPWGATQRLVARGEGIIVATDLRIDHLGYDGDQTAKHARNLPLLRARVAEDPNHVYSWNHLGQVLAATGAFDEAEAAWERGVAVAIDAGTATPGDWLVFDALISVRVAQGRPIDELLASAVGLFGEAPALRITRARLAVDAGRHEAALEDLLVLATIDPDEHVSALAMDERWFRELLWGLVGTCYFELGAYADAADAYGRAHDHLPSVELRAKRTVAEARARAAGAAR